MFNPNLLCTQFGIEVGASKIVSCVFGGARLNLPELGSEGKVSGKFSWVPNSGRVGGAGWGGREPFRGNLASGCLGGGDARRPELRTRFFFFPPCSD